MNEREDLNGLLSPEDINKVHKILNEKPLMWTEKGYKGVLCEDAETPLISYSDRANKVRAVVEKVVEKKTEMCET